MARGLRPLSTDPAADLDILFRRAVFAWLIADGDMHLKNLALLKIAEPDARTFASIRFAPLYDAITTPVFPGLAGDRTALKLNGEDDRLSRRDFMMLGSTIGLPQSEASRAIAELTGSLVEAVETVRLPAFAANAPVAATVQDQVLALAGERCAALAAEAG